MHNISFIKIKGFAILLSIVGLFGVIFKNRCLLVLYEIIVLILFLAHLAALIVLLVFYPRIDNAVRDEFNRQVSVINNNSNPSLTTECSLMQNASSVFTCCGSLSPQNLTVNGQNLCCKIPNNYGNNGCTTVVTDLVKRYSNYYIIIPTSIILFIELCALITIPILICYITNEKRFKY
jgi:hypothetical protein